ETRTGTSPLNALEFQLHDDGSLDLIARAPIDDEPGNPAQTIAPLADGDTALLGIRHAIGSLRVIRGLSIGAPRLVESVENVVTTNDFWVERIATGPFLPPILADAGPDRTIVADDSCLSQVTLEGG